MIACDLSIDFESYKHFRPNENIVKHHYIYIYIYITIFPD